MSRDHAVAVLARHRRPGEVPRTAAQFAMAVSFDDVEFGVEPWNFQLCESVAAIDGMQSRGLRGGARFGRVGDGFSNARAASAWPMRESKRSRPPRNSRQAPPASNTPDNRFFRRHIGFGGARPAIAAVPAPPVTAPNC